MTEDSRFQYDLNQTLELCRYVMMEILSIAAITRVASRHKHALLLHTVRGKQTSTYRISQFPSG